VNCLLELTLVLCFFILFASFVAVVVSYVEYLLVGKKLVFEHLMHDTLLVLGDEDRFIRFMDCWANHCSQQGENVLDGFSHILVLNILLYLILQDLHFNALNKLKYLCYQLLANFLPFIMLNHLR